MIRHNGSLLTLRRVICCSTLFAYWSFAHHRFNSLAVEDSIAYLHMDLHPSRANIA